MGLMARLAVLCFEGCFPSSRGDGVDVDLVMVSRENDVIVQG